MTTSTDHSPAHARVPLRLRLSQAPGRDVLDGGWWPQSRDPAVELADLVDHFPLEAGEVVRVLYSPPDWDGYVRRVRTASGWITVGSFSRDDSHLVLLSTSDRRVLRVLVVPPGVSRGQGEEALLAAATVGNAHEAEQLLATVTEWDDVDPADQW